MKETTVISDFLEWLDTMQHSSILKTVGTDDPETISSKYGQGKFGVYKMALEMMNYMSEEDETLLVHMLDGKEDLVFSSVFTIFRSAMRDHLQDEDDEFKQV